MKLAPIARHNRLSFFCQFLRRQCSAILNGVGWDFCSAVAFDCLYVIVCNFCLDFSIAFSFVFLLTMPNKRKKKQTNKQTIICYYSIIIKGFMGWFMRESKSNGEIKLWLRQVAPWSLFTLRTWISLNCFLLLQEHYRYWKNKIVLSAYKILLSMDNFFLIKSAIY